ncbi:unnamed protein product [Pleuronectes platessa]|uniref:Uncharacterized protein n=1 Tax=Pleuronectes platessa TaxID=8262 RepID=A0A9N7VTY4_PLEPL|nr:unnamed protein product [Pleuronectes platessa]
MVPRSSLLHLLRAKPPANIPEHPSRRHQQQHDPAPVHVPPGSWAQARPGRGTTEPRVDRRRSIEREEEEEEEEEEWEEEEKKTNPDCHRVNKPLFLHRSSTRRPPGIQLLIQLRLHEELRGFDTALPLSVVLIPAADVRAAATCTRLKLNTKQKLLRSFVCGCNRSCRGGERPGAFIRRGRQGAAQCCDGVLLGGDGLSIREDITVLCPTSSTGSQDRAPTGVSSDMWIGVAEDEPWWFEWVCPWMWILPAAE